MKNNQKGITLVALVITIIVLLILAGVTIAALSGDNGILKRGKEAKVQTNVANAKDLISLEVSENITTFYNEKYVVDNSKDANLTTAGENMGWYVALKMQASKTAGNGQASSVIASITPASTAEGTSVITSNVKDAKGQTLKATLDKNGKITWSGDALTNEQ